MEPAGGRGATAGPVQDTADFFIPDLCASRSVFVMVLLAELMVIVYVLANSDLPGFNWSLLAAASFIVQWVVLLSAALLCPLRRPFSRLRLPLAVLASLAVVALVTVASSYLALSLFPAAVGSGSTSWWLLRNALVALVLAAVLLRYFYLQQQLSRQEKQELQARLDSLRDRIRPHFLFNTLNSIASLIGSQPEAAEAAVEDLSELFRASLQGGDRRTTVADEIRLCKLYLGIEQLRLGDRLRVDWQVDAAVYGQPMPGLLLQPLVENAVYHGISRLPEGGTVRITMHLAGMEVQASVENPAPRQAAPSGGHQLALANIRERVAALYGGAGVLEVTPGEGSFRVALRYPREVLV